MKTKISAAILLIFLMSCGSGDQQNKTDGQTTTSAQPQSSKFILKAWNNMYLSLNKDSVLTADQQDSTKAEIFEKIDQGNGKLSFKASTGKFVSDDRVKNNNLIANRGNVNEWELFEFISVDQTKINIKSSGGKFVSADQGKGNILIAKDRKSVV